MKKQLILGSFLALAAIGNAQIYSPGGIIQGPSGNNNVGMGTTGAPAYKLDIFTSAANDGVSITQSFGQAAALHLTNNSTGGRHWALFSTGSGNGQGSGNFSIYDYQGGVDRIFINQASGNVGFGTNMPNACLDIFQRSPQTAGIKFTSLTLGNPALEFVASGSAGNSRVKIFGDGKTYIGNFTSPAYNANASILTLGQATATDKAISVINSTNPTAADVFAVYGDGKTVISGPALTELRVTTPTNNASKVWVCNSLSSYNFGIDNAAIAHIGCNINSPTPVNIMNFGLQGSAQPQVWIGNTKPQSPHTDFSFAVAGKMVAQSLYITAPGSPNWLPDYVFANDYKLQNLYDVEKYYKANKHLPGVPSAKEVDENGLDIAEMNIILLKKVEELTIHMVEQQKQIDGLKKGK